MNPSSQPSCILFEILTKFLEYQKLTQMPEYSTCISSLVWGGWLLTILLWEWTKVLRLETVLFMIALEIEIKLK